MDLSDYLSYQCQYKFIRDCLLLTFPLYFQLLGQCFDIENCLQILVHYIHCWQECRQYIHYGKQYRDFLKQNQNQNCHGPIILLPDIYSKDLKLLYQRDFYSTMFITTLFIIDKIENQFKCPADEYIEKMYLYTHTHTYTQWNTIQP